MFMAYENQTLSNLGHNNADGSLALLSFPTTSTSSSSAVAGLTPWSFGVPQEGDEQGDEDVSPKIQTTIFPGSKRKAEVFTENYYEEEEEGNGLLGSLPEEMLLYVLKWLGKDDVLSVCMSRRVCRTWARLINEESMWRSFFHSHVLDGSPTTEETSWLLKAVDGQRQISNTTWRELFIDKYVEKVRYEKYSKQNLLDTTDDIYFGRSHNRYFVSRGNYGPLFPTLYSFNPPVTNINNNNNSNNINLSFTTAYDLYPPYSYSVQQPLSQPQPQPQPSVQLQPQYEDKPQAQAPQPQNQVQTGEPVWNPVDDDAPDSIVRSWEELAENVASAKAVAKERRATAEVRQLKMMEEIIGEMSTLSDRSVFNEPFRKKMWTILRTNLQELSAEMIGSPSSK